MQGAVNSLWKVGVNGGTKALTGCHASNTKNRPISCEFQSHPEIPGSKCVRTGLFIVFGEDFQDIKVVGSGIAPIKQCETTKGRTSSDLLGTPVETTPERQTCSGIRDVGTKAEYCAEKCPLGTRTTFGCLQ